jgi:hypothetical protein
MCSVRAGRRRCAYIGAGPLVLAISAVMDAVRRGRCDELDLRKWPWQPRLERDNLRFVLAVLATKIRNSGRCQGSTAAVVGKSYEGFLISEPVVGRGMVIFRDPNGRRMVTTSVRRVLTTGEQLLYVETENSVYRLAILDQGAQPASATG